MEVMKHIYHYKHAPASENNTDLVKGHDLWKNFDQCSTKVAGRVVQPRTSTWHGGIDFPKHFSMFNDYVSILPGDLQPLTEVEQQIAFFKAMPETLKNCWITHSGNDDVSSDPLCD